MPSYVIHLAVAKLYLQRHTKEELKEFIRGTIAPDLLEKPQSHYGEATSSPDLEKFKSTCGLKTSYDRGYYLHLKTDLLFYRDVITPEKFSEEIYEDYNRINRPLIQKYELDLPEEIKRYVQFRDDDTVKLHKSMAVDFIDMVGKLELEELSGTRERLQYADWETYYQRCVLGTAEEVFLKEEFIKYAISVKHSPSERKALAKKAADGDKRAKELFIKSYIPVIAARLCARYRGHWIPKEALVNCIDGLCEYKEKIDVLNFDNQPHYKSRISKMADDVCIRYMMEQRGLSWQEADRTDR